MTKVPTTKRAHDELKIAKFSEHAYDFDEWRPWTGNNYIKSWYDVKLADGTIVKYCWPNAGLLCFGAYAFDSDSNVMTRLSEDYPFSN